MAEYVADDTARCGVCGVKIVAADDDGRLLGTDSQAFHADGTPHDTRTEDSGISGNVDLGWFTLREYELNEIMRDMAAESGADPDDPKDEQFVPMPTVGSAWDSWASSTDDERASYLRISPDVHPLFVVDRVAQAERDLALAMRLFGANTSLDDVFRCPSLLAA